MGVPRYFVAGAARADAASPVVAHALDAFFLQGTVASQEWVVGLDDGGLLTAQRVEPRSELRPSVQAAVAFHEATGRRGGVLVAEQLHLFEAHVLARAPDLPGINDPLYLQGCLIGPLDPNTTRLTRQQGQLTITRADLLHGLVLGAPAAFHHDDTVMGRTARTFHALLPGDRDDQIKRGYGGVLAYPTTGLDPQLGGPGNEPLINEMLYSVLKAVWRDVAFESPPPARHPDQLPVPNRSSHDRWLIADGFTIRGDRATRKKPGPLGWFIQGEAQQLPSQGTTDVFMALAREALTLLPSWPPARIGLLMTGLQSGSAEREREHAPAAPNWREAWIRRFLEEQQWRDNVAEEEGMGQK
jgi:hypothetical protein